MQPIQTQTAKQNIEQDAHHPQPASTFDDKCIERVIERKIAYYSDFEINLDDWKSEYEYLEFYAKNLQQSLGKLN